MIYAYRCQSASCGQSHDVIKSVKDFERREFCPTCQSEMRREVAPRRLYFGNTAVQERIWQPALGKAATKREMQAEAKAKGWIEVGNEKPEKHLRQPETEYPSFTNDDIADLARRGEI